MQVLSDLIPITNGEVFDIIRRNREQRNIKALPHFHAQSMAATTGSSAHQHLVMTSRFAFREAKNAATEKKDVTLIQASVLSGAQPHINVPHTEVKILHYLQNEKDMYGPTSVVMKRFESNPDYNDSDNEEESEGSAAAASTTDTAATHPAGSKKIEYDPKIQQYLASTNIKQPTPLAAIAKAHHDKIEQGAAAFGTTPDYGTPLSRLGIAALNPSDPAIPSLFVHESTSDNVVHLEHTLALLRLHGQDRTRQLISRMKQQCFVGSAVVKVLAAAWEEQTKADKASFVLVGGGASHPALLAVNQSTIERGVAKRLSSSHSAKAAVVVEGTAADDAAGGNAFPAPVTSPADLRALATSGLPISPTVLRNLIDIRHSVTAVAHVAAVVTNEIVWIGDTAEFMLRYEVYRASEERYLAGQNGRGGNSGGGALDAFSSALAMSAPTVAVPPPRYHGVEDPAITLPQALVEGMRYSAVMALCTVILGALRE